MFHERRVGQERGESCTFFLPGGVHTGDHVGSRGEGKGLRWWTDSTYFSLIYQSLVRCSATATERARQRKGGGER